MEGTIVRHKKLLIELMDPDFGLLDELYACGNLQKREFDAIRLSPSTIQDRCERLLDCIMEKRMVNELLSALERTNQTHLVNYIRADGDYKEEFKDDWPLGENERKRMAVNRCSLIDIIDHDICVYLYSNDVISLRQRDFILSKLSKSEKNEALLEVMYRFSVKQFWKCVTGLRMWNLNHVATILSQSGAVVGLHANLQGSSTNADERDEIIAREMVNILHNGDRPILPEEWSRISSLVELKLFHARKGDSVLLYFHCLTIEDLLRLHGLVFDGNLRRIVEEVFTQLLRSDTTIAVSLTWSEGDFERGSLYFSPQLLTDDSVLSNALGNAPCQDLLAKDGSCSGWLRGKTVMHKWGEAVDQKINKPGFAHHITSMISWQRLYVIVSDGYLLIYKSETSKKPDRVIDLCGFQRAEKEEYLKVKDVPLPFKVISEVNNEVMYYGAMSEPELKKWIEGVTKGIDDAKKSGRQPIIVEKKETMPKPTKKQDKPLPKAPSFQANDSDDDEDDYDLRDDYNYIPDLIEEMQQSNYDYIPDPIEEMQPSNVKPPTSYRMQLPPLPGRGGEVEYEMTSPKVLHSTVETKLSVKPRKDIPAPPSPVESNVVAAKANLKKTPQVPAAPAAAVPTLEVKQQPSKKPHPAVPIKPPPLKKPHPAVPRYLHVDDDYISAPFEEMLQIETKMSVKPRKHIPVPPSPVESNVVAAKANLKKTPQVPAAPRVAVPTPKVKVQRPLNKPPTVPKPFANVKPAITAKNDTPPNLVKKPVPQVPPGKPTSPSTATVTPMPLGRSSQGEAEDDVEYEMTEDRIVFEATWKGTSEESTALMRSVKEEGVFMIRESTTGNGDITLQVYSDDVVRKYKIGKEGKKYQMAGGSTFDSMAELLTFYQTNNLPNRTTKLTKPYSKL